MSAQPVPKTPTALPQIGFSVIQTNKVEVTEGLLLPDGSMSKKVDTNFSAFLVKHKNDYVLVDTGLGSKIGAQYSQDMPYWQRSLFKSDKPVLPPRKPLA